MHALPPAVTKNFLRPFNLLLSRIHRQSDDSDSLTGLASTARLNSFLEEQFAFVRQGKSLSLIVLEIANLQSVNTAHGPDAGDAAIQSVAIAVQGIARWQDLASCLRGGEMALAMPDTPPQIGQIFVSTMRRAVTGRTIQFGSIVIKPSIIAGLAAAEPGGPIASPANLIEAAMRAAKTAAGNCVKVGANRAA